MMKDLEFKIIFKKLISKLLQKSIFQISNYISMIRIKLKLMKQCLFQHKELKIVKLMLDLDLLMTLKIKRNKINEIFLT